MDNKLIYTEDLQFTYSDLDASDNILPSSLLQAFQNISADHADIMHIGYKDLISQNLIWVVDKIHYTILDLNIGLKHLKITTWPEKPKALECPRNIIITDENNKVLIKGIARWCIINLNSRRLTRTSQIKMPEGEYISKVNYETPYELFKPLNKEELVFSSKRKIFYSNLDHNKHLNNTNYANYVLDSLPINNPCIVDMQITFLKELYLNDEVSTYYKKINEKEYFVYGYKNEVENTFIAKVLLN